MKLAYYFVCALLLYCAKPKAENFVYPVGEPNEEPTDVYGNTNGYVITRGYANVRGHNGVDLANGAEGGEVRAIGPGTVSLKEVEATSSGFGDVIMIRHELPEGVYYSLYAHLQEGSMLVDIGDPVFARQHIANVDCTGKTEGTSKCPSNGGTGAHLHFAVKTINQLGCAYLKPGSCINSGETFADYVDPLQFVADHASSDMLLFDDFDDGVIDASLWEYRYTVSEVNGELHVDVTVTDQISNATTRDIVIDPTKPIKISRRAKVFAANRYFDGRLRVTIDGYPDLGFGVTYADYIYSDGVSCPAYGFFVYRNGASPHNCAQQLTDVSPPIPPIWDTWFDEEIDYDPETGELIYSINGETQTQYNVGILPEVADTIRIGVTPWGWWTGHFIYSDNFTVSQ